MVGKKKVIVAAISMSLILVAFVPPAEKYFEIAKSLDIFATLFKEVNTFYVDEVDPKRLVNSGIEGMLKTLDPYTNYIPEEDVESFRISTTGQYGGIGALIGQFDKKIVITFPYPDFPANLAGLKVGDEIIEIEGKKVIGKTTADVSELLKGMPKTEVALKVRRHGKKEPLVFKIKREKISVKNVPYYGMLEPGIGYIQLDDFTNHAAREVSQAVVHLKEKGARGLIIDLRNNPGGLLHEAVNLTGLFIPKGLEVVSTKGKVEEWNKAYHSLNPPMDTEIPLVVLTGHGSASASEIVAGALQDYDRAVLVGQRTFGKGLVQTTRPLSYNAQLKVTTAKYYIPSGRCIQALDYTHRNEDGSVGKMPDSLKSVFKTKQGRVVYDGEGILPDVEVAEAYPSALTVGLLNAGLIFEYATIYCNEHAKPNLSAFRLTDAEYDQFVRWAKGQKFSYTTQVEADMEALMAAAQKERLYPELEQQLRALKAKIDLNKDQDFVRYKEEVVRTLEQQMAFHYGLYEGQAAVSFKWDKDMEEARKLLKDTVAYQKMLFPPSR